MACCLMAPSHYLNQCWLNTSKTEWHSSRASSQQIPQPSITEITCKIKYLKFHSNFPGANELKFMIISHVFLPQGGPVVSSSRGDGREQLHATVSIEWAHQQPRGETACRPGWKNKLSGRSGVEYSQTHWAETKWPPFSRRHFQMHFLGWKCMNFTSDFTEVCS